MGDWEEESPSDDDNRAEIENELYSMFYYHSVSDGIPDDLAEKYNVDVDDYGATISLKGPISDFTVDDSNNENGDFESIDDKDSSNRSSERYIDGHKDSSDDSVTNGHEESELSDFVKLPSLSDIPSNSKGKSRYFDKLVITCSSTGEELAHLNKNKVNNFSSPKKVAKQSNISKVKSNCSTPDNINTPKNKSNRSKNIVVPKEYNEVIDLTGNDSSNNLRQKTINKLNNRNIPVVTIKSDSDSEDTSSDESDSYSSSSSSDDVGILDSILLNTTVPFDQDYCDTSIINTDYNWRLTSSPEGWTKSMRKYYNKPSKTLLMFDKDTILQKIRNEASADWSICRADYLKIRSPRRVRCLRCQQEGHVKANCTKVFSCHMCGTPGHKSHKCPDKICLKCGSKHKQNFVAECRKCTDENGPICNVCGIQGHVAKLCTNAWRTFIKVNNADKKEGPKYCCHCGKSGHVYEDCGRLPGVQYKHNIKGNKNKKNANVRKKNSKKRTRTVSESNAHQGNHSVFPSHKKAKYRGFERNINPGKTKFIRLMSMVSSNEKLKKRQISKRIMMLRNAKKKKKFNQRHSTPF